MCTFSSNTCKSFNIMMIHVDLKAKSYEFTKLMML